MPSLDIDALRAKFPALKSGYIFADNAGGSQVTKDVADSIYDYLVNTNVQLGADYSVSVESTKRVFEDAPEAAKKLFNAESTDEIVFGSSSTANLENLARSLDGGVKEGDEFIVTGEHEANAGPWKKLASRRGALVKYWLPTPTNPENPYSVAYNLTDLLPLITTKTRIIAFTACSNILGSVVPVKEVVKAAREKAKEVGVVKLEISVDCVAYAPHRRIDVKEWDVDFCVFSFYKVYGPHISALYVRLNNLASSVTSLVHHFLTPHVQSKSYKLQPGGPGYEIVFGTTPVLPYLLSLTPANNLGASFDAIAEHEKQLVEGLLGWLTRKDVWERGVRVVGVEKWDKERVPTISFVLVGGNVTSKEVVRAFDKKGGIGIRYGHFYAYGLISTVEPKLDIDDGVVRISLVHYNTVQEVKKIVEILKEVLLPGA